MTQKEIRGEITISFLLKMILVLASIVVVTAITISLLTNLQAGTVEQACRASVVLRANIYLEMPGILPDQKNIYPVQCETQDKVIPEKLEGRMNQEQRREETLYDISDMMAKCWFMFGNGRFYNVLAGDQSCHVCYTFTIGRGVDIGEDISVNELIGFLFTKRYSPGLLLSDSSTLGEHGQMSFTPQEVRDTKIESRQMTKQRLLSSQRSLNYGIADLTGTLEQRPFTLSQLRSRLSTISEAGNIVPAIVIVNALPESIINDNSNIAYEIMKEWGVGSEQESNGLVIVFALNNGVMWHATDIGSAAVFPAHVIEDALAEAMPKFQEKNTAEALELFAQQLANVMEDHGDNIHAMMTFQKTYGAYISGGALSASGYSAGYQAERLEEILTRGSIMLDIDLLVPGELYSVAYVNRNQDTCNILGLEFCPNRANQPNSILIAKHSRIDTQSGTKICNTNYT